MLTPRAGLGLGGFVLTVIVATWLVGPIALVVAWAVILVVVIAAAIMTKAPRPRWILVGVAVAMVGLPALAAVEFLAGTATLRLWG